MINENKPKLPRQLIFVKLFYSLDVNSTSQRSLLHGNARYVWPSNLYSVQGSPGVESQAQML